MSNNGFLGHLGCYSGLWRVHRARVHGQEHSLSVLSAVFVSRPTKGKHTQLDSGEVAVRRRLKAAYFAPGESPVGRGVPYEVIPHHLAFGASVSERAESALRFIACDVRGTDLWW